MDLQVGWVLVGPWVGWVLAGPRVLAGPLKGLAFFKGSLRKMWTSPESWGTYPHLRLQPRAA